MGISCKQDMRGGKLDGPQYWGFIKLLNLSIFNLNTLRKCIIFKEINFLQEIALTSVGNNDLVQIIWYTGTRTRTRHKRRWKNSLLEGKGMLVELSISSYWREYHAPYLNILCIWVRFPIENQPILTSILSVYFSSRIPTFTMQILSSVSPVLVRKLKLTLTPGSF